MRRNAQSIVRPTERSFAARRITLAAISLAVGAIVIPGCHERSVRPGINDHYKNNVEVSKWIARFEGESREIFSERKRIVESVRVMPGMTIADIGAGTGLFTPLFAESVGATGYVFAVDIVPEFLTHIDQRVAEHGLTNVETVLCKDDSVELSPGSIDLVFVCDTYHHFEFPKSTLASIHQALKPGGEFVVIDFDRIPGKSRAWIVQHVRAGKETVIDEIESAGFELIDDGSSVDYLDENYIIRFRRTD